MPIDNPIFTIPILTGLIFVIAGFLMLNFPPRKINNLYGYRTSSSMKSKRRWDFAQIYSAKEMIKLGGLLALTGLIGLIYDTSGVAPMLIGLGLMIITVITLIVRVERALKEKFKAD